MGIVAELCREYVKTGRFTFYLLIFIAVCISLKYLPPLRRFFERPRAASVSPSGGKPILLILGLALVLRLGWIAACDYRPAVRWTDGPEKNYVLTEYDGINIYAASLRDGVWFRDAEGKPLARRPIGYPVFLGLFYALFGTGAGVMHAVNVALALLTIYFIYRLGRQAFGEAEGLLAAFFFAVYPLAIYGTSLALDEHLFLPLWYGGLALLYAEINGKKVRWAPLWYGLIFGYATMTRTYTIFMPFVVAFAYLRLRRPLGRTLAAAAVILALFYALTIPWMIRNYRHWGVFLPYTTAVSYIYQANNPGAMDGGYCGRWPREGQEGYDNYKRLHRATNAYDVPAMMRLSKEGMREWILRHPGDFMVVGVQKLLHFLSPDKSRGIWAIDLLQESTQKKPEMRLSEGHREAAQLWAFAAYYFALYLFFAGAVWVARSWKARTSREKDSILVLALCLLLYLGMHFIVFPERKYRYPLEPFFMLFAAAFVVFLVRDARFTWFLTRRSPRR